jgi:RND superfamily putative drug exporter
MFERWIRGVLRVRLLVLGLWALVAVAGLASASQLPNLLSTSLSVPSTSSAQASEILARHFAENIDGSFTVVVQQVRPSTLEQRDIEIKLVQAIRSLPGAKVTQERFVGRTFFANVDTSYGLNKAANTTSQLRERLRVVGLAGALVTGPAALQHDIAPILSTDLHRGEVIALVLAILLLVAVLGLCWALLVPFVFAAATTLLALTVVLLLAHHFLMVLYVPNVIELFSLGLGIDYSLLIIHRFRHELRDDFVDTDHAVVATMLSAGRSVMISGLAVAVGLATLFIIPVPFVRSLAIAGLLVPLVAMLGAATLLPALLSLLGRRGVRAVGVGGILSRRDVVEGTWTRLARFVLGYPRSVLALAAVVLVLLGSSLWSLQVTPASLTAVPAQMSSVKALNVARSQFGPGILTPISIVIDTGGAGGASEPSQVAARLRLAESILRDHEVEVVAIGGKAPYVDVAGRDEQVVVIGRSEFGAPPSQVLVRYLRSVIIPGAHFPTGTSVYVGGAGAQGVDFLSTIYGAFPWLVALALVLSYAILMRAFRSLLLPLLAVLLDLVSLGVAYSVMVAVFRYGVLSPVLGTYHVGQIEGWVPVFLFAVLFGLSMDYDVFIVSRMREAHDRGSSDAQAITNGLANTGGVVSAAALIMVGAFSGLVAGHVAGLQELGVGLAAGVIVDVTLVRGLVLPAVMGLLGRLSWWLPKPAAFIVGVPPSPKGKRGAGGTKS